MVIAKITLMRNNDFLLLLFQSELTPNNFRMTGSLKTHFFPLCSIFQPVRFEPGTAGCEAQTPPLCQFAKIMIIAKRCRKIRVRHEQAFALDQRMRANVFDEKIMREEIPLSALQYKKFPIPIFVCSHRPETLELLELLLFLIFSICRLISSLKEIYVKKNSSSPIIEPGSFSTPAKCSFI